MSLTALSILKAHVRADDFCEDDAYLQHLLDAAEQHVVATTNRTIADLVEIGGGELPYAITQAVLLIAGHWYNQREAVAGVAMAEVPYTLLALIKPYRRLS